MSLKEKLKNFLENGKDWERIKTTIKGIFILKILKSKIKLEYYIRYIIFLG